MIASTLIHAVYRLDVLVAMIVFRNELFFSMCGVEVRVRERLRVSPKLVLRRGQPFLMSRNEQSAVLY
jgi:hypothetical protein